jgi:hypothetical protein
MHYLSDFLEISFEDILLTPTFNSMPVQPSDGHQTNSTDMVFGYFFDTETLNEDHRTLIKDMVQDDYQTILLEVVGIYCVEPGG